MERFSDLYDEGSGLELVHVSEVLDYLGEYKLPKCWPVETVSECGCYSVGNESAQSVIDIPNTCPL